MLKPKLTKQTKSIVKKKKKNPTKQPFSAKEEISEAIEYIYIT